MKLCRNQHTEQVISTTKTICEILNNFKDGNPYLQIVYEKMEENSTFFSDQNLKISREDFS